MDLDKLETKGLGNNTFTMGCRVSGLLVSKAFAKCVLPPPRPLPQSFDSFLIIGVHSFFVAICVSLGRCLPNILSGLIFFFF